MNILEKYFACAILFLDKFVIIFMADTTSSPSFPYNGDFEIPEETQGSLSLQASTTAVNKDETVYLDIYANSDSVAVNGVKVKISFSSSYLEVIDSNSTQVGAQVEIVNTNFLSQTNEVDNSNGEINLDLTTDTAEILSGPIARVQFKATESGTASIDILEQDSALTDSNNQNVLSSVQGTSISVQEQQTEIIPPPPIDDGNTTPDLPNTALFGVPIAGILGVFFVIISFITLNKQTRKRDAS